MARVSTAALSERGYILAGGPAQIKSPNTDEFQPPRRKSGRDCRRGR
jgi:hypothetical protein